jgi:hypothetical protein
MPEYKITSQGKEMTSLHMPPGEFFLNSFYPNFLIYEIEIWSFYHKFVFIFKKMIQVKKHNFDH